MSTEIKNTLFRFVTMRAPGEVEQTEVNKAFVQHPEINLSEGDPYVSFYLQALDAMEDGDSRLDALKAVSDSLVACKTIDDVAEKTGDAMMRFAKWLTGNRETFTEETLELQVEALNDATFGTATFDNNTEVSLWDNLFYQIMTFESGYVRDAIISALVANFFLKHFTAGVSDENLEINRKLAQARIIIPENVFGIETSSATNPPKRAGRSTAELDKRLQNMHVSKDIEATESLIKSLKKAKSAYGRNEQAVYMRAMSEYKETVAAAYLRADRHETTTTNPVTGETTTDASYDGLVVPDFEYTATSQNEFLRASGLLSEEETDRIASIIEDYHCDTFDEIIAYLQEEIDDMNRSLFEKAELSKKLVKSGGIIIPSYERSAGQLVSIAGESKAGAHPLVLLFDNVPGDVIEDPDNTYRVVFNDLTEAVGSEFQQTRMNGKLQLTLFPNLLTVLDKHSFGLEGTFAMSDNTTLVVKHGNVKITGPSRETNFKITSNGNGDYTLERQDINAGTLITANQSVIQYIPSGFGIKRLGIADYRKVEQEVCCYVPGEVSHIENVMAREYKEKSTRRLRRQEDTLTATQEKESESLTDSTSTDRFEMNQEITSVINEQNSLSAGAQVHWGGKVETTIHGDFANNTSQETSNHQAVTHAQDITERALDRVVQKVKEERVTKVIEEYEENNKHGFDNRKGDKHVSGVYRWVDKIFRNKIINYGKRLMYEFMIPEPAAFHNAAIKYKKQSMDVEVLIKPIDPRVGDGSVILQTPDNVSSGNYLHWAAIYNVEVDAKPDDVIFLGKSFSIERSPNEHESVSKNDVVALPEGYIATEARAIISGHDDDDSHDPHSVSVIFGDCAINAASSINGVLLVNGILPSYMPISHYRDEVPVSMQYYNYHTGAVTISVKAILSDQAYKKWQCETFNAIVSAYEDRLAEYYDKLEQEKAVIQEKTSANPLFYRQIENSVLRKNCIEYLISHDALGKNSLIDPGNSVSSLTVKYTDPLLETYAAKVKFFEEAFEWDLMSYYFYPFYWAFKENWADLYNVDETNDSIFRAFLQSGMARIILTVRPGFEEAVNWYMATGQIWNGGQVPVLNDPLFISIIEELRQPEGEVEETWESRVPTSLTVIQAGSIGLNVDGLPCDDDCKDYKLFDSDGHPVLDADGNPVSTNPIKQAVDADGNPVALGNVVDDLETVTDDIEEIKDDIAEIKTALNITD